VKVRTAGALGIARDASDATGLITSLCVNDVLEGELGRMEEVVGRLSGRLVGRSECGLSSVVLLVGRMGVGVGNG